MTELKRMTELEEKVMEAIALDPFFEDGEDSVLWLDCFLDTVEDNMGIEPKKTRALLVTLQEKGYLDIEGGKDGYVALGEMGKAWLKVNEAEY